MWFWHFPEAVFSLSRDFQEALAEIFRFCQFSDLSCWQGHEQVKGADFVQVERFYAVLLVFWALEMAIGMVVG